MKTAALGQFGDTSLVFIELEKNYDSFDKELQKEIEWLEKAVKRVCNSSGDIEKEVEKLFPNLFALRVKGLSEIEKEGKSISDIQDEILPVLDEISDNQKLRKLSHNVVQSFGLNRKLTQFLKQSGQLTSANIKAAGEVDYKMFVVFSNYMPSQLKKMVLGLTRASLFIEFLAVVAYLINENEVSVTGKKLEQLNKLSSKTHSEFMGYVELLIAMGEKELLEKEKGEWASSALVSLAKMYDDDEPDYSDVELKEPNPKYNSWKRDQW